MLTHTYTTLMSVDRDDLEVKVYGQPHDNHTPVVRLKIGGAHDWHIAGDTMLEKLANLAAIGERITELAAVELARLIEAQLAAAESERADGLVDAQFATAEAFEAF